MLLHFEIWHSFVAGNDNDAPTIGASFTPMSRRKCGSNFHKHNLIDSSGISREIVPM